MKQPPALQHPLNIPCCTVGNPPLPSPPTCEGDVADAAAVGPSPRHLQLINDLHGPHLGRPADRASWQRSTQSVPGGQPRAELASHCRQAGRQAGRWRGGRGRGHGKRRVGRRGEGEGGGRREGGRGWHEKGVVCDGSSWPC
jgi:hypothetical protein